MNADVMAKLVEKFAVAAQDRLERLNNGLLTLERSPDNAEIVDEVMREIHTLKGESKMLGLLSTNAVAHTTEDYLVTAKEHNFTGEACDFDTIYDGFDMLAALIELGTNEPDAGLKQKVAAFLPAERVPSGWADAGATTATPTHKDSATDANEDEPTDDAAASDEPASHGAADLGGHTLPSRPANTNVEVATAAQAPGPSAADPQEPAGAKKANAFLRVATEQMETLTRLGGDLQLLHADSERLSDDLTRLVSSCRTTVPRLRDYDASMSDRDGLLRHIVALYDEMDAHLRKFRDASFQSRVRVGELQEEVSSARMQELSLLLQKYPRAVRDLGKELGKKVRVEVDDGGIAADDDVLRSLADPLLHIIRNAVDHGLESTAERIAAGKSEEGTVSIIAKRLGTRIEIRVQDDGGGVNTDAVKRVAISRGVLTPEEAANLDEADAQLLLFRPGFSTAAAVTDVSGRGVGLDVVRTDIERMGGNVRLESQRGVGSTFILTIPTTVALTPVLVVQLEQGQFGIPSSDVSSVIRIATDKLVYQAGTYSLRLQEDQRIPMLSLARELGFPNSDGLPPIVHAVVIGSGSGRVALHVRRLVGERPAVQTALNPLLSNYKSVTGSAIVEGGEVLPVLNTVRLLESTRHVTRRSGSGSAASSGGGSEAIVQKARLRVLIVEDSDLTREMLIAAVGRLGYEIDDAANGRQGVEKAKASRPDIIMTDLDMPVLNGFGLIAELREDPTFDDMPIVVLSTRSGDEDKRKARENGADDYLVKAQFSDGRLGEFLLNAISVRQGRSNAA